MAHRKTEVTTVGFCNGVRIIGRKMDTEEVSQSLKSNHKVGHRICHSLVLVKRSTAVLNLMCLDSLELEQNDLAGENSA